MCGRPWSQLLSYLLKDDWNIQVLNSPVASCIDELMLNGLLVDWASEEVGVGVHGCMLLKGISCLCHPLPLNFLATKR